jgi:hypothetical protein
MKSATIEHNKQAVDLLFQNRLRPFEVLIKEQKNSQSTPGTTATETKH